MAPLSAFTVILTRSREGFLSLGVAMSVLVWRSRNRLMGILFGILASGAILAASPDESSGSGSARSPPTSRTVRPWAGSVLGRWLCA